MIARRCAAVVTLRSKDTFMAEMWDVAAHVETNPGDHPQRWRLAKKLYAAHEYRLALEHLNVLKNEWTSKMNVRRYLGATYFRLGRYAEAIAELNDSIKEWPDEIGMREQLAYVLKADKRNEEALEAWENVLRLQPDHAIAKKAVAKLKKLITSGEEDFHEAETRLEPAIDAEEDIPTPPPMPGMECSKCGAQNSEEFGDCWRCGAPLPHAKGIGQPILFDMAERSMFIESKLLGRLGAIATLGLLLYALFLGIRLLLKYNEGMNALSSWNQIYDYELVPSRIAAGLAMLLFWPIVLRLTIRFLRISARPKAIHTYIGGILLGALALVIMLMPMPATLLVPGNAILLFMALVVCVIALQFRMGRALLVWAIHFIIMFLLGSGAFWATEIYRYGAPLNPAAEVRVLWHVANSADDITERLPSVVTPLRDEVRWQSSGSQWVDAKAANVLITLRLEDTTPGMRFQIYEDDKLKLHEELDERQNYQFQYTISPEKKYELAVSGAEDIIAQIVVQSLLPFDAIK